MLALATVGFAVNFWAWALISPLGPMFRKTGALGELSESDVALLVAVPVIVGSLGRIIVGALTDRYGGRLMFPLVSAATVVPVLFIGFVAIDSYTLLLVGGFFLGIGGTAFAVGVPFVNAWFPPERRGLAVGIFGAGMGGTAISALTTVKLYEREETLPFVITAVALAAYAVVAWLLLRDAPGRVVPTTSLASRLAANSQAAHHLAGLHPVRRRVRRLRRLLRLPAGLPHQRPRADPGGRRQPDGGLRGRRGPVPAARRGRVRPDRPDPGAGRGLRRWWRCAPPWRPGPRRCGGLGTVAFLAMAAALGAGSGAVFALIARVTEPARVGGVTGLVGAAGGLGGFVPPLLMGWVYGQTDSYAIGLWLLAATAALTLAADPHRRPPHRPATRRSRRMTSTGMDGALSEALVGSRRFFTKAEVSDDLRSMTRKGGREGDVFYRDRWSHDKVVRSTHGVNCTGSCSWKVYVKDGIITWEAQQTDYPSAGADRPEYEPRGCPRGAAFSWYTYSPTRVRYPYVRGVLLDMFREAKQQYGDPVVAWGSIVQDPEQARRYKAARGKGGLVRASWDEVAEIVAAAHVYTVKRWGPDRIAGFSPIPAMSPVSYASGARFLELIGAPMLSFYDWYADLPNASPQMFGDQTDVPESGDWWDAGYLIMWGSNVPMTRTPDAHWMTEARYRGQKVVAVAPDYAENVKFADEWVTTAPGTDGALAMAMGHVILQEFFVDQHVAVLHRLQQAVHRPAAPDLPRAHRRTAPPTAPASTSSPATSTTPRAAPRTRCGSRPSSTPAPVEVRIPQGAIGHRFGDEGAGPVEPRARATSTRR